MRLPGAETKTVIAFDFETSLIVPYLQAPPIVCMSWDNGIGLGADVVHIRDPRFKQMLRDWLADDSVVLVGHGTRFEVICLLAQFPSMRRAIFRKLRNGGFSCTKIRQNLIDIAEGAPEIHARGLDELSELYGGPKLDKQCPWRVRYGLLLDTPVAEWEREAVAYSGQDATATLHVWRAQQALDPSYLVNEQPQVEADVYLALCSAWGIRTDKQQAEKLYAETVADIERDRVTLVQAGLLRENGTKDKKAAEARLVAAYRAKGEEPPYGKITEKMAAKGAKRGNVKLDADACENSGDPVLVAYTNFGQASTLLSKVKRLQYPLIQANFGMVRSGRVSCSQGTDPEPGEAYSAWGSQLQNPPRAEGVRQCFVPPDGWAFISCDWNKAEMHTWAQECLWKFGVSDLLELLLDPGRDAYAEFAAKMDGISFEQFKQLAKDIFKSKRQGAKAAVLGGPGGLGPGGLLRANKGMEGLTLERCGELLDGWKKADRAVPKWLAWGKEQTDNGWTTGKVTVSGRIFGKAGYCDLLNTVGLQGPTSDAFKAAWCAIGHAMYAEPESVLYGCRLQVPLHDEILAITPLEKLHECAYEICRLMNEAAKPYVPDCPMSSEPAACLRWEKAAEPVFDSQNRLIPWQPKP
jgi:3'-5' exonuclease